jgi:phospholipid/cholesterol/gamma-HCH transport system permease protein
MDSMSTGLPLIPQTPPGLDIVPGLGGAHEKIVRLSGEWTALSLARERGQGSAARRLVDLMSTVTPESLGRWQWDLSRITRMDHVGGQALWQVWARRMPSGTLTLNATQRDIFARIAELDAQHETPEPVERVDPVTRLGLMIFTFADHLRDAVAMLGRVMFDLLSIVRSPKTIPWVEISANLYGAGARALPITALVAFLIGIVLSYLSAQQLQQFGANQYIVNILGLAVIRELGPMLAAILIAGRSGSAFTAQIGVMRVTEELDAMRVMGIAHSLRLVLPRVIALGIAMPLLVAWTDIIALLGGALAAKLALGIDLVYFVRALPAAVPVANLWIGLGKGVAFGMLIALAGCHFGFRVKANSQSLGEGTTASVVTSITTVILADALFAILFLNVGD